MASFASRMSAIELRRARHDRPATPAPAIWRLIAAASGGVSRFAAIIYRLAKEAIQRPIFRHTNVCMIKIVNNRKHP
jgi:hypothetical protein